jgi:hypothetical protein
LRLATELRIGLSPLFRYAFLNPTPPQPAP